MKCLLIKEAYVFNKQPSRDESLQTGRRGIERQTAYLLFFFSFQTAYF